MSRHKLPLGIQDFRSIREDGCYYVDKTPLIHDLVKNGSHYFLSRPRRFGKSLLISTMKALFEGRQDLFEGLAIHDDWDWSVKYPVIRLSFSDRYNNPEELDRELHSQLQEIEIDSNIPQGDLSFKASSRLRAVINGLYRATQKPVVVLVDEYDKPILDQLSSPDTAKVNRDYLRGFYGMIKDCAEHVRFVFVTGITVFTKVSLFSGLNNLTDISLDPRYASICGYADRDLDTVFAPELGGLDRAEIRRWYNGYHWLGEDRLYNPWDILNLFDKRRFDCYWALSGSPGYLIEELARRRVSPMELERRLALRRTVSKFDVADLDLDALLFQSGYLTIKEELAGDETDYVLGYPNHEVAVSLSGELLDYVTRHRGAQAKRQARQLAQLLADNDFAGFEAQLGAYLFGIPHQWYDVSEVERYESHYASMVYMAFRALGLDLEAEASSSLGAADLVLFHAGQVFVMEFKLAGTKDRADKALSAALAQIRDRGYGRQYAAGGGPVHLLALAFGRDPDAGSFVEMRAEPL